MLLMEHKNKEIKPLNRKLKTLKKKVKKRKIGKYYNH